MNYIIMFLIGTLASINLSPLLSSLYSTSVKSILLFITVLLAMTKIKINRVNLKIISTILIFILFMISYKLLGVSKCEWGIIYNQSSFFLSIILSIYIIQNMTDLQKKLFFAYFFVLMIFLIISNIQLYSLYGDIIRYMETQDLSDSQFGQTTFNTTCFIFFTACYYFFLKEKQKIVRLIVLSACILTFYYIFFCGARGTVVILCFFVICVLPLVKYIKSAKVLRNSLFILIPLFAFLLIGNDTIDYLVSISPERLADRFLDLKNTTNEGLTESSFSGRYGLYWISIESFFSGIDSIIFGIGDRRGSGTGLISYKAAGIGGHSEILDHCARFGVLGIIIVGIIFKYLYNYIKIQPFFRVEKNMINCIMIVLIMCAFVKSVLQPNIGCAVYIILPLSFIVVYKREIKLNSY